MTKVVFSYQGDQIPAYAEISLYRMSGMGTAQSRAVGPINYLYENRYEIPIMLSANPGTWAINFFVVDAKGRFSNEIGCQVGVR
jgi:hypothetical protein